eukprot:SAG31_NODE_9186_length_1319_cov_2.740164_1_plen_119_part_00
MFHLLTGGGMVVLVVLLLPDCASTAAAAPTSLGTAAIHSSTSFSPPVLGWMSWEVFRCDINCTLDPTRCIREQLYTQMTDALVSGGFHQAGYHQVSIDDCWQHNPRAASGLLRPNAAR